MLCYRIKKIIFIPLLLCIISCSGEHQKVTDKRDNEKAGRSEGVPEINNSLNYSKEEGVVGVFDVPAMLCLSILDSATMKDVANKVSEGYKLLEKEIREIGAEKDGPAGQINYNNDPTNFKFECLYLIKSIPKKQPEKSKIVVLETGKMLVYNYYGPYDKLYTAYNMIRDFCVIAKLAQNGPMREFYVTDPATDSNSEKWLTRIIVPVRKGA